jgi:hypothetical protein
MATRKGPRGQGEIFEAEVQRVDTLLAKWGILVGNLGGSRGRRREIATSLATENAGVLTDLVLAAFMAEAETQGVKNPRGWIAGILSDKGEREAYLPEIVKQAAGKSREASRKRKESRGPGDHMIQPGEQEELKKRADQSGRTYSEEVYLARRGAITAYYWADGKSVAEIAEFQGMDKELCREEISKGLQVQFGKTIEEWEADKLTGLKAARKARLAPTKPEAPAASRAQKLKDLRDAPPPPG